MSHGEAISVGMAFAARLSAARGLLPAAETQTGWRAFSRALGLPVRIEMDAGPHQRRVEEGQEEAGQPDPFRPPGRDEKQRTSSL